MKKIYIATIAVVVIVLGILVSTNINHKKPDRYMDAFVHAMAAGMNTPESVDKFMREYNGSVYIKK